MLMMMIIDKNIHLNNKNDETQMDDCEVRVPSTLLDWNTMAAFFPWGLLLIRWGERWWIIDDENDDANVNDDDDNDDDNYDYDDDDQLLLLESSTI